MLQCLRGAVQQVEAVPDEVVGLGAGLRVAEPFRLGERVQGARQRLGRLVGARHVLAQHRLAAQSCPVVAQAGGERQPLVGQPAAPLRVAHQPGCQLHQGGQFLDGTGAAHTGVRQPPFQFGQGRHAVYDRLHTVRYRRGRPLVELS